ncbi:MAG: hypothetical protein ACFCVA_15055 [Gammaproteobacteria bacterium]
MAANDVIDAVRQLTASYEYCNLQVNEVRFELSHTIALLTPPSS